MAKEVQSEGAEPCVCYTVESHENKHREEMTRRRRTPVKFCESTTDPGKEADILSALYILVSPKTCLALYVKYIRLSWRDWVYKKVIQLVTKDSAYKSKQETNQLHFRRIKSDNSCFHQRDLQTTTEAHLVKPKYQIHPAHVPWKFPFASLGHPLHPILTSADSPPHSLNPTALSS
jgi:hypothetical protein